MNHALRVFLTVLMVLAPTGCGRRDPGGAPKEQAKAAGQKIKKHAKDEIPQDDEIFTKPKVLHLDIQIPRSGMSQLRGTQWGGGGEERPVAKATVREGGNVYNDVAVHLKGAAGSFRPVDHRPALTLNFDKFVPGQSLHGFHKISLNNSEQDSSLLSEKICREMFDAAGVPVPRAGYAMVRLNGRDLGLYVMLEGANRQFLKRYFRNAKGNLFDGGFCKDIDEALSVNSGDNPNDTSGLQALNGALGGRTADALPRLEKVLDVDRFISMVAMEVMVWHWDGYALNKNNWRVFHDLDSHKMVFIPHGLDQTFGNQNRGPVGLATQHWNGKVAQVMMRNPEVRTRYRERFGYLYTNVFQPDKIMARIDDIQSVIIPTLAEFDPHAARSAQGEGVRFKQMIQRRYSELGRELARPLPAVRTVKFTSASTVPITGWTISPVGLGEPKLSQEKDAEGRGVLKIQTTGAGMQSGSWRARMSLPAGRYRFEGRVKVDGVVGEAGNNRAGADLRVSKAPQPPKIAGTSDWQNSAYEFEVEEESNEVELICELARVSRGEASFDLGSLRLVRLP